MVIGLPFPRVHMEGKDNGQILDFSARAASMHSACEESQVLSQHKFLLRSAEKILPSKDFKECLPLSLRAPLTSKLPLPARADSAHQVNLPVSDPFLMTFRRKWEN